MALIHNFDEAVKRRGMDSKKYDESVFPADVIPLGDHIAIQTPWLSVEILPRSDPHTAAGQAAGFLRKYLGGKDAVRKHVQAAGRG